jgi:hypothetical protein
VRRKYWPTCAAVSMSPRWSMITPLPDAARSADLPCGMHRIFTTAFRSFAPEVVSAFPVGGGMVGMAADAMRVARLAPDSLAAGAPAGVDEAFVLVAVASIAGCVVVDSGSDATFCTPPTPEKSTTPTPISAANKRGRMMRRCMRPCYQIVVFSPQALIAQSCEV